MYAGSRFVVMTYGCSSTSARNITKIVSGKRGVFKEANNNVLVLEK